MPMYTDEQISKVSLESADYMRGWNAAFPMKDLSEDQLDMYPDGDPKFDVQHNGIAWQKGLEDCAINRVQDASVVEIDWYRKFTK